MTELPLSGSGPLRYVTTSTHLVLARGDRLVRLEAPYDATLINDGVEDPDLRWAEINGEAMSVDLNAVSTDLVAMAPATGAVTDFRGWRGYVFAPTTIRAFNVAMMAQRAVRTGWAFALPADLTDLTQFDVRTGDGVTQFDTPQWSMQMPTPSALEDLPDLARTTERLEGDLVRRDDVRDLARRSGEVIDIVTDGSTLTLIADGSRLSLPYAGKPATVRVATSYLRAGLKMLEGNWIEVSMHDHLLVLRDDATDVVLATRRDTI